MKLMNPRLLPAFHLLMVLALIAAGCSTREDPSEVLLLTGNHSPGNLAMVTTDTSSKGYQYLEPKVSPDLTQIVFTADWNALPPPGQPPDDPPTIRQLVLIDNVGGTQPLTRLASAGARLVNLREPLIINLGVDAWTLNPMRVEQKGGPVWLGNDSLVFWMKTPRGQRLFRSSLNQSPNTPVLIYFETEDFQANGRFWQHFDPAVSPDLQWVAFARFGHSRATPDQISSYTRQSIWVVSLNLAPQRAFQITSEAALIGGPTWSPDGTKLVFHGTLENDTFYGSELFSVDFDTTGLAATGQVALDRNRRRLTYTRIPTGNPIPIMNTHPSFSADASTIIFVSTRRAPSITLHDRSIWRIPADGRQDPVITFFSREDDVFASYLPGANRAMVLSSAMGFPTSMLDRLEREAYARILAENPGITEVQAQVMAAAERQQLEGYTRVMTHLYVFSDW